MTEIVDLSERLPKPDPELVETARVILKEVQAGRIVNIAAVYVTADGDILTTYHFDSSLECLGAISFLQAEAIALQTEPAGVA